MSHTEEIDPIQSHTIDWSRASLPVGVDVQGERPWLKLTEEELSALVKVLTKGLRISLKQPDGREVVHELEPIADVMGGLKTLARWAEGALQWKRANPEK